MTEFTRLAWAGMALLALVATAAAQDNFEKGKTGAQLYASDCAMCHKSAQQLRDPGGLFGLRGFLSEHYTASREAAARIAAYVEGVQREERARGRVERAHKRRSSATESSKRRATKPEPKAAGEAKDSAMGSGSEKKNDKQ
jgi:mono/diheme cytochrome c family protein